ncbi:MAG: hypothetical protein JWM64_175 [Frankiales bacterium]|nr:hypothetical protein [Frankiales bacterium]
MRSHGRHSTCRSERVTAHPLALPDQRSSPPALDLAGLRLALAPGGSYAVVQPLVRLADGAVLGYEALGRVTDSRGQGPAEWLERAGAAGLRTDLELALLRAAAALGAPPDEAPLFVNVSASTLLDPRFEEVQALLPLHVLELSERDRIEDYARLLPRLRAWRAQGVGLAVDDVGAGYANMAHVLQLEPAYVKIDRFIVAGLDRDPRRRALVAALHALASTSGACSVAEGVERPEELAVLRELGVDLAQGYLLGRPGPDWSVPDTHGLLPTPLAATATTGRRRDDPSASVAHASAAQVCTSLAADAALLPSVYLARGGRLRCVARRGQWLVLDGMEPGTGITGAAYAADAELVVPDVATDPRYRQAVPGVRSEVAVPLHAGGRLVGVLNVDLLRPVTPEDVDTVRRAAVALEHRLTVVGIGEDADSLLQQLVRSAPRIAAAADLHDLGRSTVQAALDLSRLDTGVLWEGAGDRWRLLDAEGPDAGLLGALDDAATEALRDLVRDTASCSSAGPGLDLATGPTALLRTSGVRAVVLVPVRDGRRLTGLLLLTSRAATTVAPDVVQALELLALQTGSRATALLRQGDLERRASRDPLTGVGNRLQLDEVLGDPAQTGALAGGWVVALDLDGFKGVNDRYGHAAGDEVLRAVAQSLQAVRPEGAQVVRLGGDEFVVLLPAGDEQAAHAFCAEVRARTRPLLAPYGADVSLGLAAVGTAQDLPLALVHADEALYARKRRGGRGLTSWPPESVAPVRRRTGRYSGPLPGR